MSEQMNRHIGDDGVQRMAAAAVMLLKLSPHEAIAVACGVLLQASYDSPDMLRTVLSEPVVREGFRGESLISTLVRATRS